jgi:hypothetical protein
MHIYLVGMFCPDKMFVQDRRVHLVVDISKQEVKQYKCHLNFTQLTLFQLVYLEISSII